MGQGVEDDKAFGRSLDEFNEYVLQKKAMMERGLDGCWRDWHQHLGRHFGTEPPSFYELKHLDSVGLRVAFDRAGKIVLDGNDPRR
jgi:hypothetical protein